MIRYPIGDDPFADEEVDEDQDDVARCRVCGCTDETPCEGGCFWIRDPEGVGDLCSNCGPDGGGIEW